MSWRTSDMADASGLVRLFPTAHRHLLLADFARRSVTFRQLLGLRLFEIKRQPKFALCRARTVSLLAMLKPFPNVWVH